MPADGLNVGTSTFGGGVSQTITKENLQRLSRGERMSGPDEPRRGIPPELKDPKYDAKARGPIRSLNPLADRAPAQESNFPLRAPAKSSPVKPIKEEQKVATSNGGDVPAAADAKGSDPGDETPYLEPEASPAATTTEPVSELAAPSAPAGEGLPDKSFVAEVETSKRSVVETTQNVTAESVDSNESDLGSGRFERSVYTPPEFLSPPEGTHPRRRPAPPQLTGWRSLAATTSALILGLYFGLQLAAVIAPSSLNFSVILGILLILMGERDGLFYRVGGVVSKLAKPFSIFSFTSGVSLIASSLIVNNLMVELHPNWAKPLLDALIR